MPRNCASAFFFGERCSSIYSMVMHSRTFASGDESDLTARFSEEGLLEQQTCVLSASAEVPAISKPGLGVHMITVFA